MERNAIFGYDNPTEYEIDGLEPGSGIPLNHPWHTLSSDHSLVWTTIHEFYVNKVAADAGQPYYDRLRLAILTYLTKETYFLGNSTPEQRLIYLHHLREFEYVARPDVALSLVQSLWEAGDGPDPEVYNFSQSIEYNNREYLGEADFEPHYLMYQTTYETLRQLGDVTE